MTRRNGGEMPEYLLRQRAGENLLDPERPVEELREELDITKCRWCKAEFVHGWTDKFCCDQCEVDYINEFHRD